jgi:hypothetical protein
VLGEASGGGVPVAHVVSVGGPWAEDGDDGFGLFASRDPGADAEIVGDLFIEVADLGFDAAASGQDRL